MAKLNTTRVSTPVFTHEGGKAQRATPLQELRRAALTAMLWEDTFYEKGSSVAQRMADLVGQCKPTDVAALAVEARDKMYLRHTPLFLTRELARQKGVNPVVEATLAQVIQRADELSEFLALYWKDGKQPLSHGVRKGLRMAFGKFDAYQLAKYDRDGATIRLRDVMFMVQPKPKDGVAGYLRDQRKEGVEPPTEGSKLFKALAEGTLESPDTWEVALSAGANKKETFERLLKEGKLGGLAVLRNLRGMLEAGVSEDLIRDRLQKGVAKAMPFRFLVAEKYAPRLSAAIESAMLKAIEGLDAIPGKTIVLVDVSGSMDDKLSAKSEVNRIQAASGIAIVAREKAEQAAVFTFSNALVEVPARRGFALADGINRSQGHGGTYLARSLRELQEKVKGYDRIIVITDEQSHDGSVPAWMKHSYVVNVAPYKNGVSYQNGWTHIDGWSERILDYILAVEVEG